MNKRNIKYAIIGAGNGGQTVAGYLGYLGYDVKIYDTFKDTIDKINSKGYIELSGYIEGIGKISLASTNIEEVLKDADVVMVINPSIYHRDIAQKCAPYLNENQIVFLHPGGTFGAFAFKKGLEDFGCNYEIPVAESNTLIYACRMIEPGKVYIGGKKDRLLVATLPADENERVCSILKEAYPEIEPAKNVLVTSLDNTNPIVHPAPTLLNTSLIESEKGFLYYHEGFSNAIGEYITGMDNERIEIAKLLGLEYGKDIFDLKMQYEIEYNTKGEFISDILKEVDAYDGIYGPRDLNTRYINEDIPMGLVPIVCIGKLLDMPTEKMELIIKLGEIMTNQDLTQNSRNLENLGLDGMSASDIILYSQTGKKQLN